MPAVVALQACPSYAPEHLEPALDAVLSASGPLGSLVQAGQSVLLKPNLISDEPPERAATTHPAVLDGLVRRLLDLGARPLIGDAPAWGGPHAVSQHTGVQAVCDRYGLRFAYFHQHAHLPSRHPRVARHFHVAPEVLEADLVINVPKLKAHAQLGFTAAQKNLYGCLARREKAWHHFARSRHDSVFARYLVAYADSLPVTLHLCDAVVAMEGAGPRMGTPKQVGVLAASRGAVELDTVLADLIAVPPSHRLLLDAARDLGIGETDLARIALAGDPLDALRVNDLRYPTLLGVFFSPYRLLRGLVRNWSLMRRDRRMAEVG
ncbi:MAG: DUF362 domain-containing protein [Fimbriimonadaceae bacterium]|nr:DUF362 domain-containing protein [Fimbriimonadaceae bacterium]